MTADERARVEEALGELIGLSGPDQQAALDDLRRRDPQLVPDVEALLACQAEADAYFARFPSERGDPPSAVAGRRVGAYRITRELGRGGMGAVYAAERADGQFTREVAVKFISVLAAGSDAWRRFEREKRLVASITHPNIAQLLDAGASEDGVPYIVMELVDGTPIDAFCRQRRLGLRERLSLFRQVCDAVQFIHRSLIVHCDLKPANLLVTADGVPKVLDFGISRVASGAGDQQTLPEQRLLTLDYASPEQVRGEPLTVATDIYSLGVILYVLLTGWNPQQASGASPTEVIRRVCEQDPPAPGSRVGGLSRDLDAVVLKALAKAPLARYGSAADLGADVQRAIEGRPVVARRASPLHRAERFAGRNRLLTAVAGALVVAVFGGLIAVAWQARIAERERALAQMRFDQGRAFARNVLYGLHDRIAQVGGSVSARRLLVGQAIQYLESLRVQAADDPALRVELAAAYRRLGEIQGGTEYFSLGDTAGALQSLARAAALLESLPGHPEGSRELARVHLAASGVHNWARDDRAEREAGDRALRLAQELVRRQPSGAEERFLLARALQVRAFRSADTQRDLTAARDTLAQLAREHPADVRFQQALGVAEHDIGSYHVTYGSDWAAALAALRRALAVNEALDRRAPGDRRTRMNLSMNCYLMAVCLIDRGEAQDAPPFARRAVDLRRALAVEDPEDERVRERLAASLSVLGNSLWASGRPTDAAAPYREALALVAALPAPVQRLPGIVATRAHSLLGVGRVEQRQGRHTPACAAFIAADRAFEELAPRRRYPFEEAQQRAAAEAARSCAR